ncbi:hypothetical protein ACWFPY_08530 [Nocardia fluminea]
MRTSEIAVGLLSTAKCVSTARRTSIAATRVLEKFQVYSGTKAYVVQPFPSAQGGTAVFMLLGDPARQAEGPSPTAWRGSFVG